MNTSPATGRLGPLYLALSLAQAAHSIEEMSARLYDFFWTATGLFHQYVPAIPQFRMSADTFAVINMTLIAILLGSSPFVFARRPWALSLAVLAGIIETLNGAGHLAGVVVFGGYVPGALTAPFLLVLGILLLAELRRVGGLGG